MKVTVEKNQLVEVLSRISSTFVASKAEPQGSSILVRTINDNQIEIQSLMHKSVVIAKIPAVVEVQGETFIIGKPLLNLAKVLSGSQITLDNSDSTGYYTSISDGKSKYRIGKSIEFDYYFAGTVSEKYSCTDKDFKSAISKVISNCENFDHYGNSRPFTISINFAVKGNRLELVSANLSTISKTYCPLKNNAQETVTFNLYGIVLETVMSAIKKDTNIKFGVDDNGLIQFDLEGVTVITSPIKFAFPDISDFVADNFSTAVVDTKEFLQALNSVSIIARENIQKAFYIRFEKEKNRITFEGYNYEGENAVYHVYADVFQNVACIMSLDFIKIVNRLKTSKILIHIDKERGIWNIWDENKEDLHITTIKKISKYRLMYDI